MLINLKGGFTSKMNCVLKEEAIVKISEDYLSLGEVVDKRMSIGISSHPSSMDASIQVN